VRGAVCCIDMRTLPCWILCSSLVFGAAACHGSPDEEPPRGAGRAVQHRVEQVAPPIDLHAPPADARKTPSGLRYQTLVTNVTGRQVMATDTAVVHYTGWRQRSGETFFTTTAGRPLAIDLAHAAPGFAEVVPLLHKGEKAVLWLPSGGSMAEPVVYEVEVVDVVAPQVAAKQATRTQATVVPNTSPR
jgi:FKBP-type peptidyl-prolyl isomerase-like protein